METLTLHVYSPWRIVVYICALQIRAASISHFMKSTTTFIHNKMMKIAYPLSTTTGALGNIMSIVY